MKMLAGDTSFKTTCGLVGVALGAEKQPIGGKESKIGKGDRPSCEEIIDGRNMKTSNFPDI